MKNLALFIFWLLIFTGFKTFGQVNTISDTHTKITISKTIHTFSDDGACVGFPIRTQFITMKT
jgi:hypothetical protein